jgi:predicted dehydrogenase
VQRAYPQSTAIENIQPILQDPNVKGVVVASSAVSHHALAKELLMADRDVLVEKPMALSSDHAAEPLGTFVLNVLSQIDILI